MLRSARLSLGAALLAIVLVGLVSTPARAAVWFSTDRWGSWSSGGYTLYNDVWGSGAGSQQLCMNSHSNWQVVANHPNTSGVKSYANASLTLNRSLSSIRSLTSSFNVTVPNSGSYETTYDLWANNNAYEIMVWMKSAKGWQLLARHATKRAVAAP